MDVEHLEKITALAKEIGLEGKELQDFIRDERVAFRENERRRFEQKNMIMSRNKRDMSRSKRDLSRSRNKRNRSMSGN